MAFAGILRQATAVDVLIGPFVDSADGDSEEGGLTIAQADVRLSKNGQAGAQKNDNTSAAHDADGFYNCELDATDTDTVGQLTLYVHVAGALAVRHDFQVIEEAAYDNLFAASAPGPLAANSTGSGLTAIPWNAAWDAEVQSEAADALTVYDPPTKAELDSAVAPLATATDLATVAGYLDTEIAAILADTNELQTDWANGGRLDNILDARASQASVDEIPTNAELATALAAADDATLAAIAALNNLSAAQVNAEVDLALADYDGPTNAEMVARTLAAASYATATALQTVDDEIAVIDGNVDLALADTNELQGDWANGGRLDNILDARASQASVDDVPTNAELATALGTADDAVLAQVALVKAKTDNLPVDPADASDIAAAFTSLNTKVDTIDDFLDTEIAAILAAVDTEIAAIKAVTDALPNAGALTTIQSDLDNIQTRLPAALVDGRIDASIGAIAAGAITAAAIATGAIDADALSADAVDEIWAKAMTDLAAVPGATASAAAALNWLFELARNKLTQSDETATVFKDDGATPLATATVSNSGGVTTRGEWT